MASNRAPFCGASSPPPIPDQLLDVMGDSETYGLEWDAPYALLDDEQAISEGASGLEFSGDSSFYVGNDCLEVGATAGLQSSALQQQGQVLPTGQFSQYLLAEADHSGCAGTSSTFTVDQQDLNWMIHNSNECATGVSPICQPWVLPNSSVNPQGLTLELQKVTQRMEQNGSTSAIPNDNWGERDPNSPASVGTVHQASLPAKTSHAESEKRRRDTHNKHLAVLRSLLPVPTRKAKVAVLERAVMYIPELQKENEQLKREIRRLESAIAKKDY